MRDGTLIKGNLEEEEKTNKNKPSNYWPETEWNV